MTSIGDSWEEVKNELFSNEEIIEIENNAARMKKLSVAHPLGKLTKKNSKNSMRLLSPRTLKNTPFW